MMERSDSSDAEETRQALHRSRVADVMLGLAAIGWLVGMTVSIALEAWPMVVLLIGLAAAAVRMVRIVAYRD